MPSSAWRALAWHGLAQLSPPEAEHALLELPSDRAQYVRLLEDMAEYPARSPIGDRIPSQQEVKSLQAQSRGAWSAVVTLDDERALRLAAVAFQRVFVLDPLYDLGRQLYAAWHDPFVNAEDARRVCSQSSLLVRAAELLTSPGVVLAPDHLPGSWCPRPGWREPRSAADPKPRAAWSLRCALVLVYWADRLGGVACAAREDLATALRLATCSGEQWVSASMSEPQSINEAALIRSRQARSISWDAARKAAQHRHPACLEEVVCAWSSDPNADGVPWRLSLARPWLPDPAMLIRRVLAGHDPMHSPALPRVPLRRPPLSLTPALP
jgi:hypothetical protein